MLVIKKNYYKVTECYNKPIFKIKILISFISKNGLLNLFYLIKF